MSLAHMTLLLIGVIALAESLWAVMAPDRYREVVARLAAGAGPDEPMAGVGFAILTILIWVVAATGHDWAHRALFIVGILFMMVAFLAFRPDGLARLMEGMLLRRSTSSIRVLYLLEFFAAVGLIALAGSGR